MEMGALDILRIQEGNILFPLFHIYITVLSHSWIILALYFIY